MDSKAQPVQTIIFHAMHNWWLLVLGAIVIRLLTNKYGRALHKVPGPFLAGFSDLWRLHNSLTVRPHESLTLLHERSRSKLVRMGPRAISVSDASLVPLIYGANTGFTKSDFIDIFKTPYQGRLSASLFTAKDERYHAMIRKPIASAYSMSTLVEFEERADSTTALLMQRLEVFAQSNALFDPGTWFQMYAFDFLGEVMFSKKFGFLEDSPDVKGIIADIKFKIDVGGTLGILPAFGRLLTQNWLVQWLTPVHPFIQFTVDRMRERRQRQDEGISSLKNGRDFLTRCYEAQQKQPDVVTDDLIRIYNVDNVQAGSDTTAIALSAILYHLITTPVAMRKLLAEIDALPQEDHISWKVASSMPYLQACIKEGMRLHPVIGLLLERKVPIGGVTLHGHYLPEGTIVGCNPWVLGRSKDVFGEDANSFRPERWLEASKDELRDMDRAHIVFGYVNSNRVCIGRHIALLGMSKLLPQLLKHYHMSLPENQDECEVLGGWFTRLKDFQVVIRRRTS